MARKIALRVESLEVRALLSSLAYSLTTDKSEYAVGQPVQMTFTETNTSNQNVSVDDGPAIDGFNVTLNGTPIWMSNSGIAPQYVRLETLKPGQSLTETATWNGESTANPSTAETGSFVVTNELAPTTASASFQIQSPVTYSVTPSQPTYQFGQPVQLTLTATNPSNQSVAVGVNPASFTVTQGGDAIWTASASATSQTFGTDTLAPGQSITQTVTWDGTTSWLGQQIDHWGTFAVSSPEAQAGSTELFQIDSPLTSTLTTEKPTYAANEPVVITLQQTNSSDQPITFLTGSNGFVVQQNGTTVFTSATRGGDRNVAPARTVDLAVGNVERHTRGQHRQQTGIGQLCRLHLRCPARSDRELYDLPADSANADAHNHSDPNPNRLQRLRLRRPQPLRPQLQRLQRLQRRHQPLAQHRRPHRPRRSPCIRHPHRLRSWRRSRRIAHPIGTASQCARRWCFKMSADPRSISCPTRRPMESRCQRDRR